MNKPRPPIPSPIKRAIRQRCGFGCIICGKPIYEYHHINGYYEHIGHIETEITLLCDTCHRKEQGGIIPRDYILKCDSNPYNKKVGASTPERIWYSEEGCYVHLGTNVFGVRTPASFVPLLIDGVAIIQVKYELEFLISIKFLDRWNRYLLSIEDNELVYSTQLSDVDYRNGMLTIRIGRRIVLQASFKAPCLSITTGIFWYNGVAVVADSKGIFIRNEKNYVSDCTFMNAYVGIAAGRIPKGVQPAVIHCPAPTRLISMNSGTQFKRVSESQVSLQPGALRPEDYNV